MFKNLRPFFVTILLLVAFQFVAYCQLPSPKWVNDIGGTGDSKPTGMITDSQNNVYVSGYFSGTVDFDPSAGVKNLTSVGGYDIYVAKYTSAGALIWAVSFGGSGLDQVNNMTVDANGNPTITGQYDSPTLQVGTTTLQSVGFEDIFIIHLDKNGNVLWGKSIGGSSTDRGEEVTADNQGNLVATSIFQSTFTIGGTTVNGQDGVFSALVHKYDSAGNLLWDFVLGGNGDTEVYGDDVGSDGNIVISGSYTGSVDFDPLGTHHVLNSGSNTGFVAKYSPAGKLIWVNSITGSFVNNGSALSIDLNNNVYLTGAFASALTFGPGATLNPLGQDTFLAKYSSTGTFQFMDDLGSSGAASFPYQIVSDANNNVYISGYFTGTIDFNPDPAVTANVTYHGQRDFFLAKYDANGKYQWAFGGGSSTCDQTLGIELAIDNNNNVILGGSFCSTVDFDPSTCVTDNVTAKDPTSDTFIAQYTQATIVASQITAFTIPQQTAPAVIDQTKHTIAITVAAGTNLSALVPTVTVSNSGTISPVSGLSQNFTSPVVYNVTSNCPATSYTVTVTLAAKSATTCSGASNVLTGDTENPVPTAYTWQVQQGGVWVNAPGVINNKDYQTSTLINITNANVIYSLRRQITVSGVISYDSYYDLTIQPLIAIVNNTATAPAITAFCNNGTPGVITGSTPTGGNGTYIYQWQSSTDGITFTDIPTANLINFTPGTLNTTTYYRRKVTSGTCVVPVLSNVIAITIIPAITNNVITAPAITAFCTGGDASTINGSAPSGGTGVYSYQWQMSADNVTFIDITGANLASVNPPFLILTTYYRRTVTSGVCNVPSASNVVTITITIPPAVPVIPSVQICTGNTASLSITSPQQGVTYDWYDSASKTNHLATGPTYITGVLTDSQTYYVEASNGGCNSLTLGIAQVTVNGVPADPQIVLNPVQACDGSVTTLSILNPQPGYSYNWYATNANGTALFTGTDFVTPPVTANITYYVEAANATGCVSIDRVSVNVIDNPLPTVATADMAICPGGTATLTATSTDQNAAINWYSSATGGDVIFTGSSFTTPALSTQTSYYAEAVDNTTGCVTAARASATVQMLQPLTAPVVTVSETTLSSVTFQWAAVDGATSYEVSTDNGQTFTAPSSGIDGLTHTVSGVQAAQSLTIVVIANGAAACQLSAFSAPVTGVAIDPKSTLIYVPNAFTPNGDGNNDIVYVHSENIKSLKFYIYDQWGELLYTSTSQQNGWDGSYKGTREPVGVYVYYLEAVMLDGEQVRKKGTITLLR